MFESYKKAAYKLSDENVNNMSSHGLTRYGVRPDSSCYCHILVTYGDCQVGKYPGFAIFNFSISAGVHYPPSSLLADLAALVVSPLSHWLMPVALVVSPHCDWLILPHSLSALILIG